MNSHKNARTTFAGRKLLIERIGAVDRSSRPRNTRTTVDNMRRARIEQLRRNRMPMRTIARVVGLSVATISRVLAALGLSSLKALEPKTPVVRYERSAPGEMIHMDTKNLSVNNI